MVKLRKYQNEAVTALINNHDTGIFDMATGTGKTFTSITCANEFYKRTGRQFLIILVPFLHLIPQWKSNLAGLDVTVNVEIAKDRHVWKRELSDLIWEFNHGYRDRVVAIGSYKSTNSEMFGELLKSIQQMNKVYLIADECHYLGSGSATNLDIYKQFAGKLGLSATPRRWWDPEGTDKIFQLFEKVVFEYSLGKALDNGFLTHYRYYPVPVTLTVDETSKYYQLSNKISKLSALDDQDNEEQIKRLLLKRSRLIQTSENKESAFKTEFAKHRPDFSLVYCPDGEIKKYTQIVGTEFGCSVHRFNSEIGYQDRMTILKAFAKNNIQTLTAIKCLDEGVDVPATRTAYFISSTTNPRQFIQRRGRILRKDVQSGKTIADIYDFIVMPDINEMDAKAAKTLVKREMPRFHEFSQYADNQFDARKIIQPILKQFDLDSYMDKSAWEVYQETNDEMGK